MSALLYEHFPLPLGVDELRGASAARIHTHLRLRTGAAAAKLTELIGTCGDGGKEELAAKAEELSGDGEDS